jgi:hypothetical protein
MIILVAVVVMMGCSWLSAAERLTRIDGKTAEVQVVAIDGERVVLTNAAVAAVALDDLWRIERTAPSVAASGTVDRVVLNGGEIPVSRLTVTDGICRFDWAGGSDAAITQSVVRALLLATGAATGDATARALEKFSEADQVVAIGPDGAVLTIDGSVKSVGTNSIVVQYQGKDRTLSRSKVGAVVFGRAGATERAAGTLPWRATVVGGAGVEGNDVRLVDGVLTLTIGAGTLDVPWSKVCGLEHRGKMVRFLSRMDPVSASGDAIVSLALPWQRDRSAMKGPLRLRGEIRDTGLGTHAPSELVFDVPDGTQRFLAVVGLDEEFGQGGDCVIVVQVDDREALRRRMRGKDAPLSVDIEIRGSRRLTLRSEPGENLDIGDHVNWYDARFLQRP